MLGHTVVETRRSRLRLVGALIGESLREVAVLVGVFAPLDAIMQAKALTVRSWLAILGFVIAVFCHGRVSRSEVAMDPIIIPISFVAILVVAGLVTHVLASREERRNRRESE